MGKDTYHMYHCNRTSSACMPAYPQNMPLPRIYMHTCMHMMPTLLVSQLSPSVNLLAYQIYLPSPQSSQRCFREFLVNSTLQPNENCV